MSRSLDIPTLQRNYSHLPMSPEVIKTGVFIAGSRPVGCTFARAIIDQTKKFSWARSARISSPRNGWHYKNEIGYQKDIDRFVHVIKECTYWFIQQQTILNLDNVHAS